MHTIAIEMDQKTVDHMELMLSVMEEDASEYDRPLIRLLLRAVRPFVPHPGDG